MSGNASVILVRYILSFLDDNEIYDQNIWHLFHNCIHIGYKFITEKFFGKESTILFLVQRYLQIYTGKILLLIGSKLTQQGNIQ